MQESLLQSTLTLLAIIRASFPPYDLNSPGDSIRAEMQGWIAPDDARDNLLKRLYY